MSDHGGGHGGHGGGHSTPSHAPAKSSGGGGGGINVSGSTISLGLVCTFSALLMAILL